MKLTVRYWIEIEKEIELTPKEYCHLRADLKSRPDIFPLDSFNKLLPEYKEMNQENKRELEKFWNKG